MGVAMAMHFRNPQNGYIERVRAPRTWALLFGPFYFISHGAWSHACISFFACAWPVGAILAIAAAAAAVLYAVLAILWLFGLTAPPLPSKSTPPIGAAEIVAIAWMGVAIAYYLKVPTIMRRHYLRKGWTETTLADDAGPLQPPRLDITSPRA